MSAIDGEGMTMDFTEKIRSYLRLEVQTLALLDAKEVSQAMNILEETRKRGGTVYVCGNGGSASTASHMTCDFNKGISFGQPVKYRFICLNDNIPTMLAIANDLGYESCFQKQLEGRLQKDDLFLAISGSGNSQNVIAAAEYAKTQGAFVLSMTGFDGGTLKMISDRNIHIPADNMQIIEDIHLIVNHLMMWILSDRGGSAMRTRTAECPVCKNLCSDFNVSFKDMPAMQSLLCRYREEALVFARGDIELCVCEKCGAIFNRAFQAEKVKYCGKYDNSQEYSEAFRSHLEKTAGLIVSGLKCCPNGILEIGCGKGTFLKKIFSKTSADCFGYDPSYEGETEYRKDGYRLLFFKEYYKGQRKAPCDAVIMRHVIEHLQNPAEMFRNAYTALSEEGIVYLETPALEWILQNDVLFDISYEHCSYYTAETLRHLLFLSGFSVESLEYSFNGQYLSVIARKTAYQAALIHRRLLSLEEIKKRKTDAVAVFLQNLQREGKTAFWGAAGKGVQCCNIFDPGHLLVDCVIDINPNKQGGYIPVSGHPIIAPSELVLNNIKNVIILNSSYIDEISETIQKLNPDVKIYSMEAFLNGGYANKGERNNESAGKGMV